MNKKILITAIISCSVALIIVMVAVLTMNALQNPDKLPWNQTRISPVTTENSETGDLTEELSGDNNKSFLEDPTFLDEVQPYADKERSSEEEPTALLLATSMAGDLRVLVIDTNGELITGQNFAVNVKGTGEYKDLDQDGSIYIAGLKAGEYYVSLKEHDGYVVAADEIKVAVKEKIAYEPIADISYLIKTEDEINALEEDTEIMDAALDMDGTEVTSARLSEENAVFGIDVSKWNGEIDWDLVAASGVKYAIIRCGYRGSKTGALVEDRCFRQNTENASKAGISVGIYFFSQAVTEVEAVEEASMVLSLLDGYAVNYPVFIDTESSGGRADSLDSSVRTLICKAFCETVESGGYRSGVYACRNWLYNKVVAAQLQDYVIWLAEYRSSPVYTGRYDMWQYTSSGTIDGITGKVDLNLNYLEE